MTIVFSHDCILVQFVATLYECQGLVECKHNPTTISTVGVCKILPAQLRSPYSPSPPSPRCTFAAPQTTPRLIAPLETSRNFPCLLPKGELPSLRPARPTQPVTAIASRPVFRGALRVFGPNPKNIREMKGGTEQPRISADMGGGNRSAVEEKKGGHREILPDAV